MNRSAPVCALLVVMLVATSVAESRRPASLTDAEVAAIITWASDLEELPQPYMLRMVQSAYDAPILGGVFTPRLRIAAWIRQRLARDPDTPITPRDVPTSLRKPLVIVELVSMAIGGHGLSATIDDELRCGRETRVRLLPSDDLSRLHFDAGIRPVWLHTKRFARDGGQPSQCLVTAAFNRSDIEASRLLHAALILDLGDRRIVSTSVIVYAGPGESRMWQ